MLMQAGQGAQRAPASRARWALRGTAGPVVAKEGPALTPRPAARAKLAAPERPATVRARGPMGRPVTPAPRAPSVTAARPVAAGPPAETPPDEVAHPVARAPPERRGRRVRPGSSGRGAVVGRAACRARVERAVERAAWRR